MFKFIRNKKVIAIISVTLVAAFLLGLRLTYFSARQKDSRAKYYYAEASQRVYSDPRTAEKFFVRAVRNDRDNAGYLWQLAVMEARNGNYKNAAKNYDKVLKAAPTAKSYWEAGNVYLSLDKSNVAKGYFRKSIEIDPKFEDSYYSLAKNLEAEGSREEATALLKDGLMTNPKSEKLNSLLLEIQTR
ncbi:MAG: hypothetical protein ACM3NH_00895 [Candidatus Saccharibacteria bacterium]